MTKSDLFKAAHKIARQTKEAAGSYRIAFACALKDLYAGIATAEAKSAEQIAFEHFAEEYKVYTRRDGSEVIYVKAWELLDDLSKKEQRDSIIIARLADGSFECHFDACNNAASKARVIRAISAKFAA